MKKRIIPAAAVVSVLLVAAVSGALSGEFLQMGVKADMESTYSDSNPVILFEVPNEVKGEFGIGVFNEELEPKTDFQVGEKVSLAFMVRWFRGGTFPVIANLTTIRILNETGAIVFSEADENLGGGWSAGTGGGFTIVARWFPDVVGNYSAGVEFEGLIYNASEDYSNISFRVHEPGAFVGKVTEADEKTAISDALVEALVNGVVKANATTDYEGSYNLQVERAGDYDIRVSAPGYVPAIRRCVSTELESKRVDFSLTSTMLSPKFNILWRANAGNSRHVAVDSQGNVIATFETDEGITVVSKFDADGNLLWNISRTFSGAWEVPKGIAIDSLDNILLLIAPNQFLCYDLWTVKLNPDGNHVWMKMFDSNETDNCGDITVDAFDNVIISGQVDGGDPFLVKYTSDGGFLWSKTLPGYGGEIVVDSANNLILSGSKYSDSTGSDYYVAKLDAEGNLLWEKTVKNNNEYDRCFGVTLDSNENIITIGNTLIVKLDSNGNEVWLRYFQGKDLVVDLCDNIFSIRESFVEMFDRNGLFLGNIDLTEDLSSIAIQGNSTLIVCGTQNVVKLCLGENATTQLDDPTTQPTTPVNSDLNTSSTNTSNPTYSEPSSTSNPESTISPSQTPEFNPEPDQENSASSENQQTGEAPPVSAFTLIISIVTVGTVSPIYVKKHKR